jgi:hypothetical protein
MNTDKDEFVRDEEMVKSNEAMFQTQEKAKTF